MMRSPHLKLASYPLCLTVPALVPLAGSAGMYWLAPVIMFGALPVLGLIVGQDHALPLTTIRRSRLLRAYLLWLPRLYAFTWAAAVLWSVDHAHRTVLTAPDLTGLILSVGIVSAMAICTAHELLHRRSRFDVGLARLMTAGCFYGHMVVEHLHHHATVGTPEYGGTARRGTSAYRFALSDFGRAFFTAWRVEVARIRRTRAGWWANRVLQDYATAFLLVLVCAVLWGRGGVTVFVGQAVFAVFAFEVITYVHHYGLERSSDEAPGAQHAWAHHCWITNCLTFNNTFHSDHHLRPWTPYYELHAMHGAPRLPASYFTMFAVALVPPLWFKLIHPRLDALEESRRASTAMPEWLAAEQCR